MSTESEPERRRLVSLAYRLLGSLAEAEDAAQEALPAPPDRVALHDRFP